MKSKALILPLEGRETHVNLSTMSRNKFEAATTTTNSRRYRRWMERQKRKGNFCEFSLDESLEVKL